MIYPNVIGQRVKMLMLIDVCNHGGVWLSTFQTHHNLYSDQDQHFPAPVYSGGMKVRKVLFKGKSSSNQMIKPEKNVSGQSESDSCKKKKKKSFACNLQNEEYIHVY